MKWFHKVPTSHTGMKLANYSVLGVCVHIYKCANKDMQLYVDIHVQEAVTIRIFSSVWEAVSFHGEEQHASIDQRGECHG